MAQELGKTDKGALRAVLEPFIANAKLKACTPGTKVEIPRAVAV
jgi:hypothetical protein